MSKLLEALHRGDETKVAELLAANPELDVFEAAIDSARMNGDARLERLLER